MDFMEWSRDIVNTLMKRKNDLKYLYHTQISYRPNPIGANGEEYDGCDEISIEVIEEDQFAHDEWNLLESTACFTLEEAMQEITKQVSELGDL